MRHIMAALVVLIYAPLAMAQDGPVSEGPAKARPAGELAFEPPVFGRHICDIEYPANDTHTYDTGTTLLEYHITEHGTVAGITVKQSSGSVLLDNASVVCVSRWHYSPAKINGKPIEIAWRTTISWTNQPNGALAPQPAAQDQPAVAQESPLAEACLTTYPPNARENGIEGATTLSLTVDASGEVKDLAIAETSGNADLDAASLQCTKLQRYIPAVKNGKPTTAFLKRKVMWKISEAPLKAKVINRPLPCATFVMRFPDESDGKIGATELAFTVENGTARDITVTKSSGYMDLDRATIECVKLWRFENIMRNGASVAVPSTISINWKQPEKAH